MESANQRPAGDVATDATATRTPLSSNLSAETASPGTAPAALHPETAGPESAVSASEALDNWRRRVCKALHKLTTAESISSITSGLQVHRGKLAALADLLEELHFIECWVHELALRREAARLASDCASPEQSATREEPLVIPDIPACFADSLLNWQGIFTETCKPSPLDIALYTWRTCFGVLLTAAIQHAVAIDGHALVLDYLTSFLTRTGYFQQSVCSACLAKQATTTHHRIHGWQPLLDMVPNALNLWETTQLVQLLLCIMRGFLSLLAIECAVATLQLCEQILKRLQLLAGETGIRAPDTADTAPRAEIFQVPDETPESMIQSQERPRETLPIPVAPEMPSSASTGEALPERTSFEAVPAMTSDIVQGQSRIAQPALEMTVQALRALLLFHRGLLDGMRGAHEDSIDAFDAAVILCESLDQGDWALTPESEAMLPSAAVPSGLFRTAPIRDWVRVAYNNSALCSVQVEDLADALEKLDQAKRFSVSAATAWLSDPCSLGRNEDVERSAEMPLHSEEHCVHAHYAWVAERVPWELQPTDHSAALEWSSVIQQFEDTSLRR
jgi:hypothetical protein